VPQATSTRLSPMAAADVRLVRMNDFLVTGGRYWKQRATLRKGYPPTAPEVHIFRH
jgi:hypothetical protein